MKHVPRWSFFIAIVIIGGLLSLLSERLTVGPSWILPVITVVLLIPMFICNRKSLQHTTRIIALIVTGMVTIGLISSISFLIYGLFTQKAESAVNLLRNAAILWATNVAVLAFGIGR